MISFELGMGQDVRRTAKSVARALSPARYFSRCVERVDLRGWWLDTRGSDFQNVGDECLEDEQAANEK